MYAGTFKGCQYGVRPARPINAQMETFVAILFIEYSALGKKET